MNCRIKRVSPKGGESLVTTGNAKVYDYSTCQILLSYGTPVAIKLYRDFEGEGLHLQAGTFRTERYWSHTTACHLGRWGVGNAQRIPQYALDAIYNNVSRSY